MEPLEIYIRSCASIFNRMQANNLVYSPLGTINQNSLRFLLNKGVLKSYDKDDCFYSLTISGLKTWEDEIKAKVAKMYANNQYEFHRLTVDEIISSFTIEKIVLPNNRVDTNLEILSKIDLTNLCDDIVKFAVFDFDNGTNYKMVKMAKGDDKLARAMLFTEDAIRGFFKALPINDFQS